MANPNPSTRTRFKKGQIANPRGAGAHDRTLYEIRRLSNQEVVEVGTLLLLGDITSLRAMAKDKNASALKVMLASLVVKAMRGNVGAFNALLDRIIGKVKDKVEMTGRYSQSTVILLP